ncbi:hypothetical protein ACFYPC_25680 [Streptomyces sp. NPDC005808]|uniref:hypothetical protein n=1 Tax=Streptomyces sp. NPDC005808 TaxID=3364734 RepID=UPI003697A96F
MTTPDEAAPLAEHFECRFDFQPGWIDLTLHEVTKAEAKALATQVVHSLNPAALEIENSAVFDDMVERALDLNDDLPTLAAAYYTESGEALANLMVDSYSDEGVERPTREEVEPLLLEWANAEATGEPQVTYLELPTGPAVRVQSVLKVKRMFGLGRKLTEFIRYAVFPPGMKSLVVVTITWEAIARTEEITALADEAVQTLRVTPLAAGSTETLTGGDAE